MEKQSSAQVKTFKEAAEFSILSAEGFDKEIKENKSKLNSEEEAVELFEKTPGTKMMFLKGNLYKSSINFNDDENFYYKLIGKAYNSKLLNRATVDGVIPGTA